MRAPEEGAGAGCSRWGSAPPLGLCSAWGELERQVPNPPPSPGQSPRGPEAAAGRVSLPGPAAAADAADAWCEAPPSRTCPHSPGFLRDGTGQRPPTPVRPRGRFSPRATPATLRAGRPGPGLRLSLGPFPPPGSDPGRAARRPRCLCPRPDSERFWLVF
ncbi:unnamed protein product [Eretmochelys imbricata]